jgi:hypothetical protein
LSLVDSGSSGMGYRKDRRNCILVRGVIERRNGN